MQYTPFYGKGIHPGASSKRQALIMSEPSPRQHSCVGHCFMLINLCRGKSQQANLRMFTGLMALRHQIRGAHHKSGPGCVPLEPVAWLDSWVLYIRFFVEGLGDPCSYWFSERPSVCETSWFRHDASRTNLIKVHYYARRCGFFPGFSCNSFVNPWLRLDIAIVTGCVIFI